MTGYYMKDVDGQNVLTEDEIISAQICKSELIGVAVYTVPDRILVKANQKYLDNLAFKNNMVQAYWQEAIHSQTALSITEFENSSDKGHSSYWDSELTPILEAGQVKYVCCSAVEVTDRVLYRKQIEDNNIIEQEIKKKKYQLEAIFETISDMLMITDKNGNIISKNSEARNTSYRLSEFENIEDDFEKNLYFDENNRAVPLEEMPHKRALRGEKVNNFKFIVKIADQEVFIDANASPVFDEKGNIELAVLCCRDITDLREKEREIIRQNNQLNYSNIKLNIALESVGAGVYHYDLINNQQTWSSKIYEFYGFDSSKLISADIKDLPIINEDREKLEGIFEDAYKNHREFMSAEFRIYNVNRGIVWLKSTGKIIYDEAGSPREMIGINLDITEQKNIEKKLLLIEREKYEALKASMKLKDEFLYLITHEFKTPLSVISSALQTMDLVCKNKLPEKADKYINTIKQNINRQIRLVNNLLDITRINSGNIKLNYGIYDIVFLTKSIVQSIQPIATQKGVLVDFSAMISRKKIMIDEEKFERILLNLLSNALKFTPSKKSINVKLYIKKYKNKNMVCISVQDEGIGIPKDKQSYIFERFGQVNTSLSRYAEGTGIGLHLVNRFVNIMNGQITLDSEEGKGSTFTVLIPVNNGNDFDNQANLNRDNLMVGDGRLIQTTAIELSDIYL